MKYVNDFKQFSEVLNEIKFALPTDEDKSKLDKIKQKQRELGIRKNIPSYFSELAIVVDKDNYTRVLEIALENYGNFNIPDFVKYYLLEHKGQKAKYDSIFSYIPNTVNTLLKLHKTSNEALKILKQDQEAGDSIDSLIEAIIKFTKDGKVTEDEATAIVGLLQDKKDKIAIDYQILLRAAMKKNATDGLSKLIASIGNIYGPLFMADEEAAANDGLEHLRLKLNLLFLAKLKKGSLEIGSSKASSWNGSLYFNYNGESMTIGTGMKQILQSLLDKKIITSVDIEKYSYEGKDSSKTYYTVEGSLVKLQKRKDAKGNEILNNKEIPLRKTASAITTGKIIKNILILGSAKNKVKADSIEFKPLVSKM